jgi:hypothetical protein
MKHISLAHKIPRRLVTVSFAILLFGPGAARAAECPESSPEDAQERRKFAKEWFSTAEAAENSGNDTEATRAYACSYKMVAHPFTAFNLARVAERSGDADLALKMYKAYLALKPDAKDREDVKSKIKALEEKLAAVKEAGTGAGATEATTEATTPPVPPPDVLTPPPEPKPAGVVERKPAEPEPEPARPSHAAEWIVGSVAVAALAGGIVTNLIARSKMSSCQADANSNLLATADSECNAARPMAYTSYVLFGVAGVGIALDAVLIILHRTGGGSSDDDSSVGFMLLPNGGGLSARGRF